MAFIEPRLIEVPLPIRTPRLVIRQKQAGDGAITYPALVETWQELHQWMEWAQEIDTFSAGSIEARNRQVMASFLKRELIELIGIERKSGEAVIWCGFHDIDWEARHCDMGFWVRKSAQRRGIATEAATALVLYAFGAIGMRRVRMTHSRGNEASRRIAERLGFKMEEVLKDANLLPGGSVDRFCYARTSVVGMTELQVAWGG